MEQIVKPNLRMTRVFPAVQRICGRWPRFQGTTRTRSTTIHTHAGDLRQLLISCQNWKKFYFILVAMLNGFNGEGYCRGI